MDHRLVGPGIILELEWDDKGFETTCSTGRVSASQSLQVQWMLVKIGDSHSEWMAYPLVI